MGMSWCFVLSVTLVLILTPSPCKCNGDGFSTCTDYPKCECNKTTLQCDKVFNQDTTVFQKFPRELTFINVTGNNFTNKIPRNIFGNCSKDVSYSMNKLVSLDLSRNNITEIHGKTFHCVPGLETLILSHNEWHINNHTHVFLNLPSLKKLILKNAFHEKLNGTLHLVKLAWYLGVKKMKSLEELDLSGNEFWFLPNETHNAFCALEKIVSLDMSNNLLTDVSICSHVSTLKILNLSSNRLRWLSEELAQNITKLSKLETLNLDNNLFQCDCGMIPFYNWLKNDSASRAVQNKRSLKCTTAFDTVNEGRPILELSLDDLVCKRDYYNATGVVVGLLFAVIIVMFIVAMYYNRILLRETWKRCMGKPVTLALIPQSQGYTTVHNQMRQM
ncbi:leucine-rich repeat-containing protein 53-like [Liolophura sinensis]|uniref:leucine-rich repeat-containing protein 53-like n=1 Tax=Liolophura sinensis TaxID=3198878 RepID=UPI00315966F6